MHSYHYNEQLQSTPRNTTHVTIRWSWIVQKNEPSPPWRASQTGFAYSTARANTTANGGDTGENVEKRRASGNQISDTLKKGCTTTVVGLRNRKKEEIKEIKPEADHFPQFIWKSALFVIIHHITFYLLGLRTSNPHETWVSIVFNVDNKYHIYLQSWERELSKSRLWGGGEAKRFPIY